MSELTLCSRCGATPPSAVTAFFTRAAQRSEFREPPIGHCHGWNATSDTDAAGLPRALLLCPSCSGPPETFRHETFQRTPATSPQDVGEDLTAIVLNLRTQVATLERQLSDARELAASYQAIAAGLRTELSLSQRQLEQFKRALEDEAAARPVTLGGQLVRGRS